MTMQKEAINTLFDILKDVVNHVSNNDFSHAITLPDHTDESTADLIRSFNENLARLHQAQKVQQEHSEANALRTKIWELAAHNDYDEKKLITHLINTIGPALNASCVSFCRIMDGEDGAPCEIQWVSDQSEDHTSCIFPLSVATELQGKPYLIWEGNELPALLQDTLSQNKVSYKEHELLIVPYGESNDLKGILLILSPLVQGKLSQYKIDIALEVCNIIKLKADHIKAREVLLKDKAKLEEKVEKQTQYLQQANERLKEDLSELATSESALRDSEERFRSVAQSASDAIISTDISLKIVFWNAAAEKLFGYSVDEVLGKHIGLIMPSDYYERIIDEAPNADELEHLPYYNTTIEAEGVHKNKSAIPIEFSLSVWKMNTMRFLTTIIRDISERKKYTKAILEEKRLLDVTVESLIESVITTDPRGKILLINKAGQRISGYKESEAIGQPLDAIIHLSNDEGPIGIVPQLASLTKKQRVIKHDKVHLTDRSQRDHTVDISIVPTLNPDDEIKGFVVIITDVTEQLRIEEELFKAQKLESIGVLAGGIAHDFNNILTGIMTNLFMAKMDSPKEGEQYQLIAEAEKASYKARTLTNQLLTFAKGGATIKEKVAIHDLVADSAGFSLSGSNVDCKLDFSEGLDFVEIDRGQIDQAMNNLLLNAKEAMPKGGTIRISGENISVSHEVTDITEALLPLKEGAYVKIQVTDSGEGIDRENLKRIFDPYFTTKKDCKGLGLSTVYSIVQKHGGYITADSVPGQGATFTLYLPSAEPETEKYDDAELELVSGSGRILVMDDDEIVRAVVEKLLRNAGYDVTCTCDGTEAINKYKESCDKNEKFDAVLMDLTIPGGMGGKEAISKMLEIDPQAKVIVSSGYSTDPVLHKYKEFGFAGVIRKPFKIDEFTQVMAKTIGG